MYLGLRISKLADSGVSGLCTMGSRQRTSWLATFGTRSHVKVSRWCGITPKRTPFAGAGGDILGAVESVCEDDEGQWPPLCRPLSCGRSSQANVDQVRPSVQDQGDLDRPAVLRQRQPTRTCRTSSTVWLRRSLSSLSIRRLFSTSWRCRSPRSSDRICPYRHGGREAAEAFFLDGMRVALQTTSAEHATSRAFPSPSTTPSSRPRRKREGRIVDGLGDLLDTPSFNRWLFAITGTWPMRTELQNKLLGVGCQHLGLEHCARLPEKAQLRMRR